MMLDRAIALLHHQTGRRRRDWLVEREAGSPSVERRFSTGWWGMSEAVKCRVCAVDLDEEGDPDAPLCRACKSPDDLLPMAQMLAEASVKAGGITILLGQGFLLLQARDAEHREPVGTSGQPLAEWLQEWAKLRPGQDAVNFLRCAMWLERAKDAGVTEFDSGGLPGIAPTDDQPSTSGE